MQSIFAAAALILAIASPVEGNSAASGSAAGHGVHMAGFGMPRLPPLPQLPHLPRLPKPR
jgi:hypothetical protein